MTRKNADATNEVIGHLREVDARANESNQALSDMVTSMAGIQDSSRQVSKIIKTIDEIAFQTNILALNAAVEAARAGAAGMGFAVVADEVRSLAHRSAQAAQDTNELISPSISRAQSGTGSVERLTESIASIMQSVSNVKRLADDVSVASRQQAAGIEQVSKAVIELEKSTQAIAGTAVKHVCVAAMGDLLGFPRGLIVNFVVRTLRKMVPAWSLPGHVRFNDAVSAGRSTRFARPEF